MDVHYIPPLQDEIECGYLQQNYIQCLKEKSRKDEVPKRKCNVEQIVWFNVECPNLFSRFLNPASIREIYIKEAILDKDPNRPIVKMKTSPIPKKLKGKVFQ